MTTRRRLTRTARRGLILPLVLVGMLLMLTFSSSVQQVGWRAMRGAQTAWHAQLGFYLADAAIVQALAGWTPDTIAAVPIGTSLVADSTSSRGWRTRRSIVRTAPLTAVVHAVAQRSWSTTLSAAEIPNGGLGDAARIRRTATRVVSLDPPALPILAAATILGSATMQSVLADGRDQLQPYDARFDDCGPLRDSASIEAVATEQVQLDGTPELYGATVTLAPDNLARARSRFDSAFALVAMRAVPVTLTAFETVPAMADWRAAVMRGAGAVTLNGSSRHVGLLAIEGDLTLRGTLRVDGVLLVRGALDASAGTLDVRGALVVRDASAQGTRIGPDARLTYAPCLVGRALVAVAVPRVSPFDAWNSP